MQQKAFEEILIRHAAPVLAGVKPSALISFPRERFPSLPALARRYTKALREKGLALSVMCRCSHHFLLFVCRPALLHSRLLEPGVREFLSRFGYSCESFPHTMAQLRRRLREARGFPHEVGLFLGYPLRDVLAFLGEVPASCKLCGYWKVYFDEEEARRVFACYDRCRELYCAAYQSGQSLAQLLELSLPAAA